MLSESDHFKQRKEVNRLNPFSVRSFKKTFLEEAVVLTGNCCTNYITAMSARKAKEVEREDSNW